MKSEHHMITRSKKLCSPTNSNNFKPPPENDDIDEHGNIEGLIDYDCNEDFDSELLEKELQKLRNHKSTKSPKKSPKKIKNSP